MHVLNFFNLIIFNVTDFDLIDFNVTDGLSDREGINVRANTHLTHEKQAEGLHTTETAVSVLIIL